MTNSGFGNGNTLDFIGQTFRLGLGQCRVVMWLCLQMGGTLIPFGLTLKQPKGNWGTYPVYHEAESEDVIFESLKGRAQLNLWGWVGSSGNILDDLAPCASLSAQVEDCRAWLPSAD